MYQGALALWCSGLGDLHVGALGLVAWDLVALDLCDLDPAALESVYAEQIPALPNLRYTSGTSFGG